jgi:uncharacterized protein (DUF433 family)
MTMNERISIDPHICHGEPCVAGTRIPVWQIVAMLENGDTVEEILEDFPPLQKIDIAACLEFARTENRGTSGQ